jgi:anti-sigma regulatory factor (Ser/Thr protein kinase)
MNDLKTTTVEVRLPTRMGYEKVAMSTAASVAKLMGFPEARIEDLKTAVAEACINAIEHGNRLNEKLSVGVVLRAEPDSLEVSARNQPSRISIAKCTARKTRAAWACSLFRLWSTKRSGWPAWMEKAVMCGC